MEKGQVAGKAPQMEQLEEGKRYAWCSCGKSEDGIWCNGAHSGSELRPVVFQLLKAYGKAAFKGNIEMVTAIYPTEKVKKGDKWIINTNLESGMSADMTSTYLFSGQKKDYYSISGESIIETMDKDAYIESNGMPIKFDLTGTMTSDIKIDKVTGWIIEANISQRIEGNSFIKENPKMPEGMKIPMLMKNKLTFSNQEI